MKVLVLSTPVFRLGAGGAQGYSGLEHLAWQIAAGLAAKGHKVSLAAPDGSECPGVEIIPIGPEQRVDERMAYNVYKDHLLTVDCVVDHTWAKMGFLPKMEGRMKTPVLSVCHAPVNTMFIVLPPQYKDFRIQIPPIEKPCFVCISEDQGNHFRVLFNRDVRVACNGIDLDMYQPLSIPRTNRYLFLARFSKIKGPDLAIEACKRAGVGLDLVGDTSITNEPQYLQECMAQCDGQQIRMVGPASRGGCVWWFSQAHCLLHPNMIFREPLGLAPLESMACGTPVIAWRYGAMRETVKHGETGFLVDSLDQMTQLIKDNAVQSIDRNRCREWVAANFSLQKMVQKYEDLCFEAIETGGW